MIFPRTTSFNLLQIMTFWYSIKEGFLVYHKEKTDVLLPVLFLPSINIAAPPLRKNLSRFPKNTVSSFKEECIFSASKVIKLVFFNWSSYVQSFTKEDLLVFQTQCFLSSHPPVQLPKRKFFLRNIFMFPLKILCYSTTEKGLLL